MIKINPTHIPKIPEKNYTLTKDQRKAYKEFFMKRGKPIEAEENYIHAERGREAMRRKRRKV